MEDQKFTASCGCVYCINIGYNWMDDRVDIDDIWVETYCELHMSEEIKKTIENNNSKPLTS